MHPNEQTNQLHAGTFGARIKPIRPLTLTVDGEIGRASFPFTQKSDANYENVTGRLTYKLKTLRLFASTAANYNTNSVTLSTYTSHARTYTAAASWSPSPRFSFDASYAKLHLSTIGGIAFFANAVFQRNESSYVSNIHSGNIGVRLALAKCADIYLGYSHVQDVGDGRGILVQANDPLLSGFQAAQTFPLTFQAPLAGYRFASRSDYVGMSAMNTTATTPNSSVSETIEHTPAIQVCFGLFEWLRVIAINKASRENVMATKRGCQLPRNCAAITTADRLRHSVRWQMEWPSRDWTLRA